MIFFFSLSCFSSMSLHYSAVANVVVKKANRSSCASCAVAAGAVEAAEAGGADSLAAMAAAAAAGYSHRVAFSRGVPASPRHQQQRQSGRRTAAAVEGVEGRGGRAVPFLATGLAEGSYNVVSAVSKAMRTARRGRPKEVREGRVLVFADAACCR